MLTQHLGSAVWIPRLLGVVPAFCISHRGHSADGSAKPIRVWRTRAPDALERAFLALAAAAGPSPIRKFVNRLGVLAS